MLSKHIAEYKIPYKTLASGIEFVDAILKRAKIVLATPLVT
jgi:putative effector of murein hydrolase